MKRKAEGKKKILIPFLCLLCIFILSLFAHSCTKKEKMYKESRVLMDTFCTITVVSPSKEMAKDVIDADR